MVEGHRPVPAAAPAAARPAVAGVVPAVVASVALAAVAPAAVVVAVAVAVAASPAAVGPAVAVVASPAAVVPVAVRAVALDWPAVAGPGPSSGPGGRRSGAAARS